MLEVRPKEWGVLSLEEGGSCSWPGSWPCGETARSEGREDMDQSLAEAVRKVWRSPGGHRDNAAGSHGHSSGRADRPTDTLVVDVVGSGVVLWTALAEVGPRFTVEREEAPWRTFKCLAQISRKMECRSSKQGHWQMTRSTKKTTCLVLGFMVLK